MKTTLFILLIIGTLAIAQEKKTTSADCLARIVPATDTMKIVKKMPVKDTIAIKK